MKKAFAFVVLAAAAAFGQGSYDVGQRLGDASFLNIPKQRCLTAPNTVEPCVKVRTRGVIYTIGYRTKGRIITYLETHDASFATADGLRVGGSFSAEPRTLAWVDAFGEVVGPETNDGWQPIVSRDRNLQCGNQEPEKLSVSHSVNLGGCRVQILGFKKRSTAQEKGVRLAAAIRANQ